MKANHNESVEYGLILSTVSKIVKSQNESKSQQNGNRQNNTKDCVKDR